MDWDSKFNQIYEIYYDKIYFYCLKKLKNTQDAEDCTQEVFALLCKKKIPMGKNIKLWLYRTADNILKCYIRKNAAHKSVIPLEDENITSDPNGQFNFSDAKLDFERYLKPDEFKLLNEYYSNKKSAVELADEFGVSVKTIYNRIHLIKTKVKQLYNLN